MDDRTKGHIYDAMFGESYRQLLELSRATPMPDEPRQRLRTMAVSSLDFAVENQRRAS